MGCDISIAFRPRFGPASPVGSEDRLRNHGRGGGAQAGSTARGRPRKSGQIRVVLLAVNRFKITRVVRLAWRVKGARTAAPQSRSGE